MSENILMFAHLFTVLPCVILGGVLFSIRQGSFTHKVLGRIYMSLMTITAILTLFMSAEVGPIFLNHFGWIHLFSILTLYSIPTALLAIKRGNIKAHKRKMILLYAGAIVIAGGFTLMPGRYLHGLLFG